MLSKIVDIGVEEEGGKKKNAKLYYMDDPDSRVESNSYLAVSQPPIPQLEFSELRA